MFEGPKLKIKRANKHIQELNDELTSFISDSAFCKLWIEPDPQSTNNVIKMGMCKPVPEQIPLILGDAIHNLRAALDIAACDIVIMAGDTPTRHLKFPFYEDVDKLKAAVNGGQIKIAGNDIVDLIVNVIKPYKADGGNLPLCGLHDIDIDDKHRIIIPTISVASITGCDFTIGGARFTNTTLTVRDGRINSAISLPGKFEVQNYGQPTFSVLFDESTPFPRSSVIPTLHQLSQLVGAIIETLEKAYLSRVQGTT